MFADLKKWMPEFHKTGAKLFVQLTAGFGRSFTISKMMENLYTNKFLRVVSKPFMDLDKITATASPSPNRWSDKLPSREMTKAEIQQFIDSFAKSAKKLKDAGVDGVEVHAVHEGYLLDQFTLHYVNKRTDEYGGSLENRMRFPLLVIEKVRAAVGRQFPIDIRISGTEYAEGGYGLEEGVEIAKMLDGKVDLIHVSAGTQQEEFSAVLMHPGAFQEECTTAISPRRSKSTSRPRS